MQTIPERRNTEYLHSLITNITNFILREKFIPRYEYLGVNDKIEHFISRKTTVGVDCKMFSTVEIRLRSLTSL